VLAAFVATGVVDNGGLKVNRTVVSAAIAASVTSSLLLAPSQAGAVTSAKTFKNCTELNKKYPHGVGRPNARDKVSGGSKPVINFKRSKALYKANKKSDRDGDGIACEKR
jgi:hypothetical protein